MLKITNKDYFLPVIEALLPMEVMSSGRTNPLLIQGICTKTLYKSDYVLKFKKASEMIMQSSCSELIALFIGRELDLNVVEPVLVNVSKQFIGILEDKPYYEIAKNSEGLNFGCKFAGPGFIEFIKNQQLSDNQWFQAQNIFAFDVFISNADRRDIKQNMLTDGDKIVIFDHEMAFGFLLEIFKNPNPWMIRASDLGWINKHYFYNVIKNGKFNFDKFVESLEVINDDFWNKVYKLIPKEWGGEMEGIKNNLSSIVKNKSIFFKELNKVFA